MADLRDEQMREDYGDVTRLRLDVARLARELESETRRANRAERNGERLRGSLVKYGRHLDCRAISTTTCQCGYLQQIHGSAAEQRADTPTPKGDGDG